MGNKPKPRTEKDRRAKVAEMKKAQAQAERRKTMLFVVIAAVVGLGLIAAAAVPAYLNARNDPANKAFTAIGVPAAEAACDGPTNDEAGGAGAHIGPGTDQPDKTRVDYSTVPPSSGEHYSEWVLDRRWFAPDDQPVMEQLVHNLEHGYVVIWYDDTIRDQQLTDLEGLRERLAGERAGKVIAAPWDTSYGELPEGKHVAMSVWGHRQLCGQVSGEVVSAFSEQFPVTVAPEPGAS